VNVLVVLVRSPLVHQCPHKEELDVGRVEMEFTEDAPELHMLSQFLQSFAHTKATHEDVTRAIAATWPEATVRTFWQTAGCEISCEIEAAG
jgi:NADPH-dependent 7-cyano-7-deazaguanine reductase QueF